MEGCGVLVSGSALVLVDQPAEHIDALDWSCAERDLVGCHGNLETESAMGPGTVVVVDVGGQHPLEMATVPYQDPVQALGPHGAHPALGVGVGTRSPHRRLHDPDTVGREGSVEAGNEFGIPVADQELDLGGALTERHGQVARLLGHPFAGWVGGHPAYPYDTTLEFYEEQDVHSGEPDCLDREEVARQDPSSLGAKELGPGWPAPPRGRPQAMAAEDVAHRGSRHLHPELGALAADPQVAPAGILPRRPQHQL